MVHSPHTENVHRNLPFYDDLLNRGILNAQVLLTALSQYHKYGNDMIFVEIVSLILGAKGHVNN